MARRLKTIARWVNENLGSYGYHATVKPSEYNYSVGSYFGGNVVGYHGSRDGTLFECWELTDLKNRDDEPNPHRRRNLRNISTTFYPKGGIWRKIKSHNSAETYRYNMEVEGFVRGLVRKIREGNPDADVATYEAEEFGAEEFEAETEEIVYSVHLETLDGDTVWGGEYYLDDYKTEKGLLDEAEFDLNYAEPAWKTATITKQRVGASSVNREVVKTIDYEAEEFEALASGDIEMDRFTLREISEWLTPEQKKDVEHWINLYGIDGALNQIEMMGWDVKPKPKEVEVVVEYNSDEDIHNIYDLLTNANLKVVSIAPVLTEEWKERMIGKYGAEEFGAETETFEARYKNDGTIAYTETEWYGGYSRTGINSWGAIPLGNFERERYYFIDGKIVMTSPKVKALKNEYNVKAIRDLRNDEWDRHFQSMATAIQKQRAKKLIMKVFREYDRNTGFSRGAEEFGAEEKRYPRSPNDEMLEGLSEEDLRTIIFAYGAEIKSMKDREKYLEKILKKAGVWYSNPTISDYMNEGMTKSEATSAYNINMNDELLATISYLLEYANKGGLKVKGFEASSNFDFSRIDKILQDMDEDGSIQLTNTDGSQVRRRALSIYENIRTVQRSIKQLREENAEPFRIDALENYLLRLKYDLDDELNRWAWVNMNAEAEEFEASENYYDREYRGFIIHKEGDSRQAFYYLINGENYMELYYDKRYGDDWEREAYPYSFIDSERYWDKNNYEKRFTTLNEAISWFEMQLQGGRNFGKWRLAAKEFGAEELGAEETACDCGASDTQGYGYVCDTCSVKICEDCLFETPNMFLCEACAEPIKKTPRHLRESMWPKHYDSQYSPYSAESFKSETQATIISGVVSLSAVAIGALIGKKLFVDKKVLG
jgi:hypothetical protein